MSTSPEGALPTLLLLLLASPAPLRFRNLAAPEEARWVHHPPEPRRLLLDFTVGDNLPSWSLFSYGPVETAACSQSDRMRLSTAQTDVLNLEMMKKAKYDKVVDKRL